MYGTIARLKVRKDKLRDFFALGKEWDDRERKRALGYVGSEILWEDREEGRASLIVRFTTRDAYRRNADSPEQDAFYQRMRACLEEDPEWIDGEYGRWDSPYARPPAWGTDDRG